MSEITWDELSEEQRTILRQAATHELVLYSADDVDRGFVLREMGLLGKETRFNVWWITAEGRALVESASQPADGADVDEDEPYNFDLISSKTTPYKMIPAAEYEQQAAEIERLQAELDSAKKALEYVHKCAVNLLEDGPSYQWVGDIEIRTARTLGVPSYFDQKLDDNPF